MAAGRDSPAPPTWSGWRGGQGVNTATPADSSLAPGDHVNHDSYGLARVLSVEGRGDDPEAKIDFGGGPGIKHLVLSYAPIEKL